MSGPTEATAAGRAYLDLQNRARRERRGTQELLTMYVVERWWERLSLDPPMRSLGVTVSASLGSFVALCLGWVCRIRRCARLFHCGFLVVPVLGGWSARGEGGWAERCGVERVELVLPGPAGG